MMTNQILIPTIFFYLAGSVAYILFFVYQKEPWYKTAFFSMSAGFLFHTAAVLYKFKDGMLPVINLRETILFAAWMLSGLFLFLRYRVRIKILGVFAAPLIFIMTTAAFFLPDTSVILKTRIDSIWLVIHVILIFMGEAALALACGVAVLYLVQENTIKTKKHRFFFKRLPSLEMLDSTQYAFIVGGFTALTIGLISGFVYAYKVWGHFWSWDPKEVWSAISWLIYAALLHARLVAGVRGKKTASLAIFGFIFLVFTFLGVSLFLGGHHHEFTRW